MTPSRPLELPDVPGQRSSEVSSQPERLAYTVAEVAKATGLPTRTVYQLTDDGTLPFKRVGRRKVIRKADLEDFINSA